MTWARLGGYDLELSLPLTSQLDAQSPMKRGDQARHGVIG